MFQIDPLKGFWTIKHITPSCGASFQMTGDRINLINENKQMQKISCPNCGATINSDLFHNAVNQLDLFAATINQITNEFGDLPQQWQIDPPIFALEEEEDKAHN